MFERRCVTNVAWFFAGFLLLLPGEAALANGVGARAREPTARKAAGVVRPAGRPSLIAVFRQGRGPSDNFDADGDFVAWGESCQIHFIRITDRRRATVRNACWYENGHEGDLALNGSRAVWGITTAGNQERTGQVFTQTFRSAQRRVLGAGTTSCDPEYPCGFRAPNIESAGGSLAFQVQVGDIGSERTVIKRLVPGGRAVVAPIPPGSGLAVHAGRIAVIDSDGFVDLRRLRDGRHLKRWGPFERSRVFAIGLSESLLVVESVAQSRLSYTIDLYDTVSGLLQSSISYRIPSGFGSVRAQPVAAGVVYFAGNVLRYAGRIGSTSRLATSRWRPILLATAGRRVFWVEERGRGQTKRLYSLRLRATEG